MDHNTGLILQKRAHLTPDLCALYDVASGLRFTYAELDRRANRAANMFLASGIKKGDRVGLLLMNGTEFIESLFGLAKIGAITVPLNWRLLADELTFILNDCGVSLLVFDANFIAVAEALQLGNNTKVERWLCVGEQQGQTESKFICDNYSSLTLSASATVPSIDTQDDDDDLFIMYTSGTTGSPKGVVHTHDTCMWATITNSATNASRLGDRFLTILPLFHIGALNPMITCIKSGVSLVVSRSFDADKTWRLINDEKISTMLAVPAMLNAMLQVYPAGEIDHSQLRYCIVGAAPVPESIINTYHDMGISVRQAYALTESCGSACIVDERETKKMVGSTGKAYFHTEVKIIDEGGNDSAANQAGEIVMRGRHMMKRYWNNPSATADTLRNGWLHTGDVGVMDEEGYITIKDRIKDMIISGGENIYPAEVESALVSHANIVDAAVIGRPDPKWGESPLAFVVTKESSHKSEPLTEADVIEYCKTQLASYKCKRSINPVLQSHSPR